LPPSPSLLWSPPPDPYAGSAPPHSAHTTGHRAADLSECRTVAKGTPQGGSPGIAVWVRPSRDGGQPFDSRHRRGVEEPPKSWSRGAASPVPIPVSIGVPPPQIVAQDAKGKHKGCSRCIADHQALTVLRATRPRRRLWASQLGHILSRPPMDHLAPDRWHRSGAQIARCGRSLPVGSSAQNDAARIGRYALPGCRTSRGRDGDPARQRPSAPSWRRTLRLSVWIHSSARRP
jgi:hypothetical protein